MTSLDYKNLKSEEIMNRSRIINIYKLNIYGTVNLMFRVKNNSIPETFWTKFQIVQHNCLDKNNIFQTTRFNHTVIFFKLND